MTFVVTSRNKLIGTWELERVDHQFFYVWGQFIPSSAFEHLRTFFDSAPEGLMLYEILGDDLDSDPELEAYREFIHARNLLRLRLHTSTGVVQGAHIVSIGRGAQQGGWELMVRADSAATFERIASIHYLHAPETFARFAHDWTPPREHERRTANAAGVQTAVNVLGRDHKNNPLFVGPPEPLRDHLVDDTALRVLESEVEALAGWRVATLDVDALLALETHDEAREILQAVAWHAYQASPRMLFLIEQFDRLLPWAIPTLKPLLARGQMRFIGTTTLEEYREKFEHEAAIQRRVHGIVAWTLGLPRGDDQTDS